ncbi:trypsin-like serine protease [Streptomyces silvensis]|uniref:Peptidase S1 domain-containing protein n=1 Tax=Streptomyces silvensis TaxID=1765722 RepID=A0A0W7X4E0_9ACTN|nr:trypsin-like serine protease [Streptomyces silvensis]KUF17562.1 hypothetical protein AT728_09060 [Streptomyces silvensis]
MNGLLGALDVAAPYRLPRAVRAVLAAVTATTVLALVAADAPAANAVIGGTEVPNDAYPSMVAVLDKGPGSVKDRQFCGGSLVAPGTVMTAAHRLVDDARKPVEPKAIQATPKTIQATRTPSTSSDKLGKALGGSAEAKRSA